MAPFKELNLEGVMDLSQDDYCLTGNPLQIFEMSKIFKGSVTCLMLALFLSGDVSVLFN
jgi:hypothetical protein